MAKKRKRPAQHKRKFKSGKRITVNLGVPKRLPKSVSKKQAKEVLDNARSEAIANLKLGRSVRFAGIGTIQVKRIKARPARKGINPFTQLEQIFKAKPASRRVKIIPSAQLKEAVKK